MATTGNDNPSTDAAADLNRTTTETQRAVEEVKAAQARANAKLDALAIDQQAGKAPQRFMRHGVTAGAAYTVHVPMLSDARLHGVQSGSVTGYVATFPMYWFTRATTNAFCATQWSATEEEVREAEAEAGEAASKPSDESLKMLATLEERLTRDARAFEAALAAAAGNADETARLRALLSTNGDLTREVQLALTTIRSASSKRSAIRLHLDRAWDEKNAYRQDPACAGQEPASAAVQSPTPTCSSARLTALAPRAYRSAVAAQMIPLLGYEARELGATETWECTLHKLGMFAGVAAPFDASVYLPNDADPGIYEREVTPYISAGLVLAPNALVSALVGFTFGAVDTTADGSGPTEPISMMTVGIGGNLDLASLLQ